MAQRLLTRNIPYSFHLNDTTIKIVTISATVALENIWDGGGSFECWFYARTSGQSNIGKFINVSARWLIDFGTIAAGSIRLTKFFDGGANGSWRITTVPTAFFNTWHHLVITYNNDSVTNDPIIYLDNISQELTEVTTPIGTRVADTGSSIFGNIGSGGGAFDGYLAQYRYYNRILTPTEVTGLYYQNNVPADAIIEEWLFSEGSGTTVAGTYGVKNGTMTAGGIWSTKSPFNTKTLATNRTII